MSFQDSLKKAIDEAPVREGANYVQFGRLTFELWVVTFAGKGEKPTRELFKDGQELVKNQVLELKVIVGVKELNPALQFDEWSRKVNIEKSSAKIKTDWTETVEPSLLKVFGDEWVDVVSGKKKYFGQVKQADSQFVKEGNKDYGVPQLIAKYKTLAECQAAQEAMFGKSEAVATEAGISDEIKEQVQALWTAMKGDANDKNRAKVVEMLKKQFADQDADELLAAIGK